jgi:uncharacterized membrane protein
VSPGRLETFADGVFAIAATLLILNVDTQVGEHEVDLGKRLLEIWPSYIGYIVSFVTIGIICSTTTRSWRRSGGWTGCSCS